MTIEFYEIIDARPLRSFAQTNTLDVLLASGRKIVITGQIEAEALTPYPINSGQANLEAWLLANANNPNLIRANLDIDLEDFNKFHPDVARRTAGFTEMPADAGNDVGDVSIGKYIDLNKDNPDIEFRVISHDGAFLNPDSPSAQKKVPGDYFGRSSTELVNDRFERGVIDQDTYRRFFSDSNKNLDGLTPSHNENSSIATIDHGQDGVIRQQIAPGGFYPDSFLGYLGPAFVRRRRGCARAGTRIKPE